MDVPYLLSSFVEPGCQFLRWKGDPKAVRSDGRYHLLEALLLQGQNNLGDRQKRISRFFCSEISCHPFTAKPLAVR